MWYIKMVFWNKSYLESTIHIKLPIQNFGRIKFFLVKEQYHIPNS